MKTNETDNLITFIGVSEHPSKQASQEIADLLLQRINENAYTIYAFPKIDTLRKLSKLYRYRLRNVPDWVPDWQKI